MVRPWRTRSQNRFTRADSTPKATTNPIPRKVSRNRVNSGFDAKKERSKASRSAKSGGLGKTPCVKAKASTGMAMVRSKTSSTKKLEATAG